ncbi:hypothetical protein ANN_13406 [Periplaneta americana]|uniref:Uncharacterized protein n=1 Tax=Periplaneta americana TaxID=6978 RepID=A0ABQ8TJB8_PERAM|nr:hypothetical protein ANN_13406 [Periplaneta americana]
MEKCLPLLTACEVLHAMLLMKSSDLSPQQNHISSCVNTIINRDIVFGSSLHISMATTSTDLYRRNLIQIDELVLRNITAYNKWKLQISKLGAPSPEYVLYADFFKQNNYIVFTLCFHKVDLILSNLVEQIEYLQYSPSWNPRANFLLIMPVCGNQSGQSLAREILKELWENFEVLNAVIVQYDTSLDAEHKNATLDLFTWFPYTSERNCDRVEEVVLINKWLISSGRFFNDISIFSNKIPRNLKGCPLKVSTYEMPLHVILSSTSINEKNETVYEYTGFEILCLLYVSRALNFTIVYLPPKSGKILDTHISMLGDISEGLTDITLSAFPLQPVAIEYADPTIPYFSWLVKWYVPCARPMHRMERIVSIFTMSTWITMDLTILSVIITIWCLNKCARRLGVLEHKVYSTIASIVTSVLAVQFSVSVPRQPRTHSLRTFFSLWIFYCFAISMVFQAFFTSFLVDPGFQTQISTLNELLESGLTYATNKDWETFLNTTSKEYYSQITLKRKYCAHLECYHLFFNSSQFVMISSSNIFEYYATRANVPICSIDEYINKFPIVMYLRKGTPLLKNFNHAIRRMKEVGLFDKFLRDMKIYIKEKTSHDDDDDDDDDVNTASELTGYFVFTMSHIGFAFYMLGVGYLLSFVVLLMEQCYVRYLAKDQFGVDKSRVTTLTLKRNIRLNIVAVRDATAKPSSGLLVGDPVFLGNFDECLSVRDARYCLATLHLRTTETAILLLLLLLVVLSSAREMYKEATTTTTTLSNAVQALIRIQQTPQTALEAPVTEGRRQSRTPISSDTPEKLSALLQTKKETSLNTYNHEAKMPRSGIKLKINNPPSLTEQPALSLRKSGSESRAEEPRRLLPISEETQLVPDFGSIHPQSERPQSPARKNTMHHEFSTSSKEEEFNSINITRVEKTECPTEPQRVDSKRSPFELDDVLLSQDSNKVVNITGKLETGANVLIEAKIPLAIAEESPSSAQQESEPRKKSSQSTESSSTNSPYKSMSSSEDSFYSLTETEADIAQFGIESQVGDSVRSQLPSELHEASVLLQESNKGAIRKRKSNSNDKFLSEAKLPSPTSEDGSESDLSASQPIETLPTMSLWRGDSSNMHKLPYVSEEDFHSDSGLESGKTTSEIESRDFGLYDSPSELGAASISLQKHIALKRKEQTNGSKFLHRPEQRPPSPIQEDFYQIQGTSDPRFGGSQPTELPARLLAREESSNTESLLLKVSSELEKREWTSGSNSRPGSSSELLSNSDPVNQSQLSNESNSDGVTPVAQVEEITSLLPQQSSSSRTTPSRYPSPSDFDIDAVPEGNISTIRTVDPDPYEADPYDPEADIWAAFSLISNSRRILIVDEPTCLPSVDGIKVLSLLWVMLIHTCFLTANLPTVNYLNITAFASHLFSTIIINASLAADTFMVTSGVLISYAFLKDMANKGFYQHEGTKLSWKFLCRYLPTYYTARYIRYLPTVSLMVLLQITFVSYLGSGPLWDYATGHMTEICRETWWSTLLMCQNLIDPAKILVSGNEAVNIGLRDCIFTNEQSKRRELNTASSELCTKLEALLNALKA